MRSVCIARRVRRPDGVYNNIIYRMIVAKTNWRRKKTKKTHTIFCRRRNSQPHRCTAVRRVQVVNAFLSAVRHICMYRSNLIRNIFPNQPLSRVYSIYKYIYSLCFYLLLIVFSLSVLCYIIKLFLFNPRVLLRTLAARGFPKFQSLFVGGTNEIRCTKKTVYESRRSRLFCHGRII